MRDVTLDILWPEWMDYHFTEQEGPVEATPTPLESWNAMCGDDGGYVGIADGWHVIIGANTGAGKSLLALNLGATAIRHGRTVGFLSLEMSAHQLSTRLYAILTGLDVGHLERGKGYSPDIAQIAKERIQELCGESGGRFVMLETSVREAQEALHHLDALRDEGCDYIIVDYLQLMAARDADTLFSSVSNVSAMIQDYAKTERIVSVGLSQFNRGASANRTESPIVQGLMGASSLENDADQVILLDHTRYARDIQDAKTARTWAILGKNRHGANGDIPIKWQYRNLQVNEALPDEEHLWPGADK